MDEDGRTPPTPPVVEQHAQWVESFVAWGYVVVELDSATARGRDSNDDFVKPSMRSRDAFYPICHRLIRPDTPLFVLTGRKDDISRVSLAESLESDSRKSKWTQEFALTIYPNATQAFDFEGLAGGYDDPYGHHIEYDPEASADAVARTRDFFAKYLGGG